MKTEDRRPCGLKRRPTGLKRRPCGLKRRPTGLKRRPTGLNEDPPAWSLFSSGKDFTLSQIVMDNIDFKCHQSARQLCLSRYNAWQTAWRNLVLTVWKYTFKWRFSYMLSSLIFYFSYENITMRWLHLFAILALSYKGANVNCAWLANFIHRVQREDKCSLFCSA